MANQIETPDSKDKEMIAHFDQIADGYDNERFISAGARFIFQIEKMVITKWVSKERGDYLLDVPCGTGRYTFILEQTFRHIIGGDISASMIDVAKSKKLSKGHNNVRLLRLNAGRLPFADKTFNTVICVSFFHLISNTEKHIVMSEFKRVLKPRGRLILENLSPVYGQLSRLINCRLSLRELPGKFVYPGQGLNLFRGFRKEREQAIGFPLFARLASVFGESTMINITLALGAIPFLKLLGYTIITELEKESTIA